MSREKGIAVGLIACYLGSSKIESWIPAKITNREEFYLPPEEKFDSPYARGEHNQPGKLYSSIFESGKTNILLFCDEIENALFQQKYRFYISRHTNYYSVFNSFVRIIFFFMVCI